MKVCLRLSKEALTFFNKNTNFYVKLGKRPNGTVRISYNFENDITLPLPKIACVKNKYTLIRLKTLKELMLLPTDEVRQVYLDSIKTKRK